ncbi:MAG: hypothetical protein ABJC12_11065 [Saprospiraceae bacterium]
MQKNIFPLTFVFALLTFFQVSAQTDSLRLKSSFESRYQAESIYVTLTGYRKNDKLYDIGAIGGKMKNEFTASPDAIPIFEKYQRQRKWTLLFSGIQLATEITALTTKNKSLRTGLLIGAGATSIVIIPLFLASNKNLSKAVWIRNRDVLNKP